MKILFIGLGSIGTRHLRNITKLLHEKHQLFEIHALRGTARKLETGICKLIHKQMTSYEDIDEQYDVIL